MLSKEIQDLVAVLLEMIKFLTDIMQKLVPAIKKLQEYLTNIEELNLVANKEFHSVGSPKFNLILLLFFYVSLKRVI